MQHIVIIGGGMSGVRLANKLCNREFVVTLISPSLEPSFQPLLLHLVFTNVGQKVDDQRQLSRYVRFVKERATFINFPDRVVETESGARHQYDSLVLATGAQADPDQILGLSEASEQFGDCYSDITRAKKLRTSIQTFRGGTIVLGQASSICICPASPLEGILLVDRFLRENALRSCSHLVFFSPYERACSTELDGELIESVFKERGIEILSQCNIYRVDVARRILLSIEGDAVKYDLPIIIPPFVGAKLTYEPRNVVDDDGFLVTDAKTLRVKGLDSVFAIGGATNISISKAAIDTIAQTEVVAEQLAGQPATYDDHTLCPIDHLKYLTSSLRLPAVSHREYQ